MCADFLRQNPSYYVKKIVTFVSACGIAVGSITYLLTFYCCNLPLQKLGSLGTLEDAQSDVHEGEYPHHRDWLGVCDIYSGVGYLCCLFKS